jgi:DNA-binding NarL/FixJ family response regulator
VTTTEQHDVAIIHASPLIRDGMAELLSRQPDIRVAGAFASAQAAATARVRGSVIVLYDQATSRQDGTETFQLLREQVPGVRILLFGVADDDQAIIECVRSGASGCMLLDAAVDDLVAAVRSLAAGAPPASPRVLTTLFRYVARLKNGQETGPLSALTSREEQILDLILKGMSNKEIAQALYLQPQTVKNYVHQVLQKLNLRNRLELIRSQRAAR